MSKAIIDVISICCVSGTDTAKYIFDDKAGISILRSKGDSNMSLITISRGIGCGGMIIARLVAEGLRLELFDDRKLQEEAIKMGLRTEQIDEKA